MAAATEAQIHISRFPDLDGAAPERLLRVRGRHSEDVEMVLRFRPETLDFEFLLKGGGASLYPTLLQIETAYPAGDVFTPKELSHRTGWSRATVHCYIDRLHRAGCLEKRSYGSYTVVTR